MTAESFVLELSKLYKESTINIIEGNGVHSIIVEGYKKRFFFKKRTSFSKLMEPIIDLVNNYDAPDEFLGMLTFDLKPYEDEDYYYFARFEADLLAINKVYKNIQLLEFGTDNHVLYNCASNGGRFLDALLLCAEIIERCDSDLIFSENDNLICELSKECGERAGGSQFTGFYKMLLGCFDD
jgi:hypothetical protein